jgi:hypothetical protein
VNHVESKWKSDLHLPFQPSHMGTPSYCHSGVPQGSHLGLLFVVAGINDVLDIFENVGVLAYADDLKLYTCVSSNDDCRLFQQDLDRLQG